MRALVLAVTLFSGLVGCSRGPEPITTAPTAVTTTSQDVQALVSTPSSPSFDKGQNAICPYLWTCDEVHWFSTSGACAASSCGSNCFQDYRCNGTCVCP
jgi:hypothetical protein